MTCWTSFERWMGSASSGRIWAAARRGIDRLALLDAVLRARLLAAADPGCVGGPAHDLVAHPREFLAPPATPQHDRVLLQVVSLGRDVGGQLDRPGDARA